MATRELEGHDGTSLSLYPSTTSTLVMSVRLPPATSRATASATPKEAASSGAISAKTQ